MTKGAKYRGGKPARFRCAVRRSAQDTLMTPKQRSRSLTTAGSRRATSPAVMTKDICGSKDELASSSRFAACESVLGKLKERWRPSPAFASALPQERDIQ